MNSAGPIYILEGKAGFHKRGRLFYAKNRAIVESKAAEWLKQHEEMIEFLRRYIKLLKVGRTR